VSATYVGFWDDIRRIYAGSDEARSAVQREPLFLQYRGGRCTDCEGQGSARSK